MQILISSHLTYYEKTLPPLLNSLSGSGVPSGSITVVIGGVSGSIETGSFATGSFPITVETIPQNLFELNALYWQAYQSFQKQPPFIFLLHDTCTVSSSFWNTIKEVTETKTITKLDHSFMGVYQSPLHYLKPWLSGFVNCKDDAIRKFCTGFFMDCFAKPYIVRKAFGNTIVREANQVDFYGTGVMRYVDHYPDAGIIKYRSNINPQVTMNL